MKPILSKIEEKGNITYFKLELEIFVYMNWEKRNLLLMLLSKKQTDLVMHKGVEHFVNGRWGCD